MYERADAFRAEIGNLDLICNIHNSTQRTMLPVEKPLIQDRLDAVDIALQQGLAVGTRACTQSVVAQFAVHGYQAQCQPAVYVKLTHAVRQWRRWQVLTWNSHHIDEKVAEALALVRDTAEALSALQANARRTRELATQWTARLLFERKEGKARWPCQRCHLALPKCLHAFVTLL